MQRHVCVLSNADPGMAFLKSHAIWVGDSVKPLVQQSPSQGSPKSIDLRRSAVSILQCSVQVLVCRRRTGLSDAMIASLLVNDGGPNVDERRCNTEPS